MHSEAVLFCVALWLIKASAQCPSRDLNAAVAVGRPCRKDCSSDSSKCKDGKVCLCDHECGYSCINTGNFCDRPPTIPNSKGFRVYRGFNPTLVPATDIQFNYDDVAEYICSPGYVKQVPAIPHYCHGRKGWTGSTVCILSCRRYNFRKVREYNLICGKNCQTDQDCVGNLHCLCDGYCGRSCVNPGVNCGQAPPTSNSGISYTGIGVERRAHYTCNSGFYVSSGDPERKCTGGGRWDGNIVSCRRITCSNPLTSIQLMGGRVVYGLPGPFYVGHEITLRCFSGRRMLGSGKRTCLESGLWSGEDTVCDTIDNEVRCPHPGIPINGRLTLGGNFSVGDFVEFECDPDYVMVGEARQECYYFLEWSGGGSPKCIDPKLPQSNDYVIAKLQRATEHSRALLQGAGAGRGSSLSDQSSSLEIYIIIDISEDVRIDLIRSSIKFAEDRILAFSAGQQVKFAVISFSSNTRVIFDLAISTTPNIVAVLNEMLRNRQKLLQDIGYGRNTHLALSTLGEMLQQSFIANRDAQRYIFLFVHGRNDEGGFPVAEMEAIKRNHEGNLQEVYVISFGNGFQDARSYNELQSLAAPFGRFLPNPNINNLRNQQNAGIVQNTLHECGKAGDIGAIGKNLGIGKIIHGNNANVGAWPWQVVVTIQRSTVSKTYAGGRGGGFRGGGSLINNKWVLTAAHLFNNDTAFKKTGNWEQSILVTFGIFRIQSIENFVLPQYVKIFNAAQVIIHPSYRETPENYDYDIALIKVGRQYNQNGNQWQQTNEGGWLNYTTYIKPVCLPCMENNCAGDHLRSLGIINGAENEDIRCRKEGAWIYQEDDRDTKNILAAITGFGITEQGLKAEYLKQAAIRLRKNARCREIVPAMIQDGLASTVQFTDRMMCGVGGTLQRVVDACFGDSGGPLVRQVKSNANGKSCWLQLGIVSWGFGCATVSYVNNSRVVYPGFYTNLLPLIPWLKNNLFEAQVESCTRNLTLVEEGRQCRKSCQTDADCRGASKRCRCDDVCGMSCFNPDAICDDPTPIQNGLINGGRKHGRTITYTCKIGYTLVGTRNRTCRSDKWWSGSSPLCRKTDCADPVPNPNSFFRRLVPQVLILMVEFRCNQGYHMLGNKHGSLRSICRDGKWTEPPPACVDNKPSFISASHQAGHEIYFVFDLSGKVSDEALTNSVTFAARLAQRLKENTNRPTIKILVFASRTKWILGNRCFVRHNPSMCYAVKDRLYGIYKSRESIRREIGEGRNTSAALESVADSMNILQHQVKLNSKHHIFLFLEGVRDLGPSPSFSMVSLSSSTQEPMFYVVTGCVRCVKPGLDEDAYTEFFQLSQDNDKNLHLLEDFYLINDALDKITDARTDYSVCGKAGDVGSIREQARLDRIMNGDEATDRAWPWHVVITERRHSISQTYRQPSFRGSGSVINNRWVLTAAQVFRTESGRVLVTYGLHRRPIFEGLPPTVKVYYSEQIIIHENYDHFNNDVALIKIGDQLLTNGATWGDRIPNVGWVNFTEYIRPVCLPCMENNCVENYLQKYSFLDGSETEEESCRIQNDFLFEVGRAKKRHLAVITGFGYTLPLSSSDRPPLQALTDVLRQGLVQIEEDALCRSIVTNPEYVGSLPPLEYTDNLLCAVPKNEQRHVSSCRGDGGGPLVSQVYDSSTAESCWVQLGIVSSAFGCWKTYRREGITKPFPGYYTNVLRMMPWVKRKLKEASDY
ncbi:uncharacterized protein LOC143468357 isoform X1 [Clavelina lepadiformis]|uniref:uncharacterized protein LOC143468357 isoform X1 n=1 Tax=Clavelina lepadiformis TaxID=159417 RepID=UPI004041BFCB